MSNITNTNEGTQKRTKKAAPKKAVAPTENRLLTINHDQEQVCDFTGDKESECGVIFTTGTINVGRRAIQMLSSQLAEWERKQRG